MSTLKTSNIQDTSGNNNSTPEEINQGRAKAWANFDGTGTVSIRTSFNMASITDNGTGDYTLTFTNAMTMLIIAFCVPLMIVESLKEQWCHADSAPVNTSVRLAHLDLLQAN